MVSRPAHDEPSVLLPRKGSLSVQYVDEPFWNVDTVFYTICNNKILDTKYFYYLMVTKDLSRISTSSTRPSLTKKALANLLLKIPPLEEQRRVVAILDKFDALVNDISTGLPAEIAARRKQYEYYRDKLLSFEPV